MEGLDDGLSEGSEVGSIETEGLDDGSSEGSKDGITERDGVSEGTMLKLGTREREGESDLVTDGWLLG